MKLVNFSVTNYRSITAAHRIAFSDVTALIGRNNEGKSNLLRAVEAAMLILQQHAESGSKAGRGAFAWRAGPYVWKRDFPVQLQSRQSAKQTILKLEFLLNEVEVADFRREIGSNLNGVLPLEIKIGQDEKPQIRVVKSGPTSALATKSEKIANFVASRIHFNYIPAVRTDSSTIELVAGLLSQELRAIEDDPRYLAALGTISDLQRPILENLAARVQAPLQEFLPNIRSVKIEISESGRRTALRRDVDVVVDDGTPTSLEFKGDGVKSLAALGLLKHQNARPGASILAIEEPESHLHPGAIHQVSEIIRSIAATSQVIITTHNPLFVDRANLRANIIVNDGAANPAKNVGAIRDLLGVKASDNLTNANYALVVEGEEDVISLRAILPTLSERLGRALKNNLLVLEPIGGAGNLTYKLSLLRTSLCATHCLLDNDDEGRKAFSKAEAEGVVSVLSCTMVICNGMTDAEFEDCLEIGLYKDAVLEEFGVKLDSGFRGSDKWSRRMRNAFLSQGKPFTDGICARLKHVVATSVAKNPKQALNANKRSAIDALVESLERLVKM